MRESGSALVKRFSLPMDEQMTYAETILSRFANEHLGDTVSRVSRDPKRKLSPQLYFSYPIAMALECGVKVNHLATAVAAALAFRSDDDAQSIELGEMIAKLGVEETVREVCKIDDSGVLMLVAERYSGF